MIAVVIAGAAVAGGADAVVGDYAWAAHLLPLAVVAIPLLTGRYIGEAGLARLAGAHGAGQRPRAAHRVPGGRPDRLVPRGGRLLASYLAVRPPPCRT